MRVTAEDVASLTNAARLTDAYAALERHLVIWAVLIDLTGEFEAETREAVFEEGLGGRTALIEAHLADLEASQRAKLEERARAEAGLRLSTAAAYLLVGGDLLGLDIDMVTPEIVVLLAGAPPMGLAGTRLSEMMA